TAKSRAVSLSAATYRVNTPVRFSNLSKSQLGYSCLSSRFVKQRVGKAYAIASIVVIAEDSRRGTPGRILLAESYAVRGRHRPPSLRARTSVFALRPAIARDCPRASRFDRCR